MNLMQIYLSTFYVYEQHQAILLGFSSIMSFAKVVHLHKQNVEGFRQLGKELLKQK